MWREGNPHALLVGMQTDAATVESSMELPQKIKNRTALCHNNSTSEFIWETWNAKLKEYMHPNVHYSIIYSSQDLETAQMSNSR